MSRVIEARAGNTQRGSLFRTLREINRERGMRAQESVNEAVLEVVYGEQHKQCPPWLKGYLWADQQEDQKGIDAIFYTDIGKIYLQIKSSTWGVENFLANHRNIPAVCIDPSLPPEKIAAICLAAVGEKREEILRNREGI